jgi:4-amino-4-deoxy-L-arabinose transferase-like glycosyltransferase
MRTNLVLFGLLLTMLVTVGIYFRSVTSHAPFAYDEADYMYAGTRGFVANFLDQPSQSLVEFVRKGMEFAPDKSQRVSMSEYIRSTGDITFYRHYHGPVYAYWIAICKALGVTGERGYRASGLVIHALGTIAIFWLFRLVFPELGAGSAFVAALVFVMNRTGLVTATAITQHVMYAFLSTLSLFTCGLFLRTRNPRYWYGTAGLLAAAFATVEIAFVLLIAVAVSVAIAFWRDGWRRIALLIGQGVAAAVLTMAVIWPKGMLALGFVKGYLYLAYIALYRKGFSQVTPLELWGFKLKTYPLEFVLPLIALIAALALFQKLKYRWETLPFLVYSCFFIAVTMKVTAPFTHYHVSLVMAAAVIVGVMFGELWRHAGLVIRAAAITAVVVPLIFLDMEYYRECEQIAAGPSTAASLLAHVQAAPTGGILLIPFVLVPTLHYYRPELTAVGYDADWSMARLVDEAQAHSGNVELFCGESVCRGAGELWPAAAGRESWVPIGKMLDGPETLYAIRPSLNR